MGENSNKINETFYTVYWTAGTEQLTKSNIFLEEAILIENQKGQDEVHLFFSSN